MHRLRLWWVTVALLAWTPHALCREVTHEDIRDMLASLVHRIRVLEDKLDRHEFREKAFGDNMKKAINTLDKKNEPLKGMMSRLDDRLSNVETILLQREEREKASQQKTSQALEDIQKTLQVLSTTVTLSIKPRNDIDNNLTTQDDSFDRRFDATDAKIDTVKRDIENIRNSLSKDSLRTMCLEIVSDASPFEKHISEAEKLLSKYEMKLNQFNGTKTQTDVVPLSEVPLADEAWHSKMTEVMERQEKEILKIQQLLSDAESMWKGLPRVTDLQLSTNQTLQAIVDATEQLKNYDDKSVDKVIVKFREMGDRLAATNEDIQRSLTAGNLLTEHAYNDITTSYTTLRSEIQTLSKSEHVLLQTADNVIATKKRIEYGVRQILAEVGDLVKTQYININNTMNDRFDLIESSLALNHAGSLTNLSSKIESEVSSVWRQIGILHQQLSTSKGSLDSLTNQTQQYINSSTSTMKALKEEVDKITIRMVELADNLNYVLGRLGLVTQEFSQMSTGLVEVLNDVKANAQNAQTKVLPVADAGPGPHNIPSVQNTK